MDAALDDAKQRSKGWLVCRKGCTACCIGVFAINQQNGTLTSLGQAGDFPKSVGFNGIAAL